MTIQLALLVLLYKRRAEFKTDCLDHSLSKAKRKSWKQHKAWEAGCSIACDATRSSTVSASTGARSCTAANPAVHQASRTGSTSTDSTTSWGRRGTSRARIDGCNTTITIAPLAGGLRHVLANSAIDQVSTWCRNGRRRAHGCSTTCAVAPLASGFWHIFANAAVDVVLKVAPQGSILRQLCSCREEKCQRCRQKERHGPHGRTVLLLARSVQSPEKFLEPSLLFSYEVSQSCFRRWIGLFNCEDRDRPWDYL